MRCTSAIVCRLRIKGVLLVRICLHRTTIIRRSIEAAQNITDKSGRFIVLRLLAHVEANVCVCPRIIVAICASELRMHTLLPSTGNRNCCHRIFSAEELSQLNARITQKRLECQTYFDNLEASATRAARLRMADHGWTDLDDNDKWLTSKKGGFNRLTVKNTCKDLPIW